MTRKKSGDGALAGVAVLGVFFALVASISKPVWIFIGVCTVVGVVWLLFFNGKKPPASAAQSEKPWQSLGPAPASSPRNELDKSQSHAVAFEPEPVTLYQMPNAIKEHQIPAAPQGFGPAVWMHADWNWHKSYYIRIFCR